MSTVVVLGSANADLVVRVDRRPEAGETLMGGDLQVHAGGKGANQAAAAARAGGRVVFLGALGTDANAGVLRDSLQQAGVDTSHVLELDRPTGSAMIMVTPDGENSIVVSPGANAGVDLDVARQLEPLWLDAEVLVMNLELPFETVQHAAEKAAAQGVRVLVNAAPAADLPDSLVRTCDPLVVNETEARLVAGSATSDDADPATLAQLLLDRGARSVVVTLGAQGCVVADGDGTTAVPAHQVEAVDTTGAGDAFVGALAAEVSTGATLAEAVRFATAYSAVSVQSEGAQPSYPSRAEVEEFLGRQG